MAKFRNVFGSGPIGSDQEAERRRMLAEGLMQRAVTPPQRQHGRIVSDTGLADGLSMLGSALGARRLNKQVEQYESESSKRKRLALAQALGLPQPANITLDDVDGGPSQTQTVDRLLTPEQQRTQALIDSLSPHQAEAMQLKAIEAKLAALQPQHETLSAGAQLVDPRTGEVIADNPRADTSGSERRVHSAQILANGNIGYIDAFSGEVVDTGQKASDRYQFQETPGGGVVPLNVRTGEASRPVVSPEAATDEAATRRGMEAESEAQARERVKVETEVPNDIATLDEQIRKTEEVLNRFRRGDFQTGPLAGRLPAVTTAGQELESYAGEDILQRISSATFGALSEGERDFLRKSGLNRGNTEAANIAILERRLTSLENAKRAASNRLQRAGRGGSAAPQGDGWSIQRVD